MWFSDSRLLRSVQRFDAVLRLEPESVMCGAADVRGSKVVRNLTEEHRGSGSMQPNCRCISAAYVTAANEPSGWRNFGAQTPFFSIWDIQDPSPGTFLEQ